jgi:mono/diheme cytochrome c family protein
MRPFLKIIKCVSGEALRPFPLFLHFILLSSCSKGTDRPLSALESQGKAVYVSNCSACHHLDPRLAGSVGPEIAESSLDLITARVLHQSYPIGYQAKRSSHLMPALPFLKKDLPAIHAYLATFKK